MCTLKAPADPGLMLGCWSWWSWPSWVGGSRQLGGGSAGLHHKDVLEDIGEGRGRLSEGLKSLSSPLVALGKLTNIPKPPSMKWVSQPLLGT